MLIVGLLIGGLVGFVVASLLWMAIIDAERAMAERRRRDDDMDQARAARQRLDDSRDPFATGRV
jgi:hypothetical protein